MYEENVKVKCYENITFDLPMYKFTIIIIYILIGMILQKHWEGKDE